MFLPRMAQISRKERNATPSVGLPVDIRDFRAVRG